MSAITGVYFGTGDFLAAARRQALRRFLSLFAAEAPNLEAPRGIALCRNDGTYEIESAPSSPARFAICRRFHELLAAADEKTVAVLGHRGEAPDKTSQRPVGRQPIKIGATIGVDDALITNAETLTVDLGLTPKGDGRAGVTVRLVNMALAGTDGNNLALQMGTRLRLVDGAFALAAWDGRFPELLFVGRYRRELHALYDEKTGVTYFSSRRYLLRNLFGAQARPSRVADNTLTVYGYANLAPRQVKIFPENLPRAQGVGDGGHTRGGGKNPGYARRF